MSEDKKLWEQVKEIEEKEIDYTLDIIIATLLVNYGKKGRCIPGLITGEEMPKVQMLINVCEFYHKAYQESKTLRAQLSEAQREIGRMNISLELQADRVDKLIDENVKAEADNAALREQLKKMEEAKEYKDHEFCKDVECGAFDNGRCHARQCCYRTAKHFHRWLKQNGYKIIKSECKKGE